MVTLNLLVFHCKVIRELFVVNEIALHTENEFYSVFLCGVIRFGKRLNYAVVGYRYGFMPPLCCSFNKLFGRGNSVHFRNRCMKMKFNALFLGVVFFFCFYYFFNGIRVNHVFLCVLIKLIYTVHNYCTRTLDCLNNCLNSLFSVKKLNRNRRGIVRNVK